MNRRRSFRVVQLVVTLGLVRVLIDQVSPKELQILVDRMSWPFALLSAILIALSHVINIVRWKSILPPNVASFHQLFAYYGAGLFSNNFLPTGLGGDGIRIILLSRTIPLRSAVVSVGLDRVIGLAALSGLGVIGILVGLPPRLGIRDFFKPPENGYTWSLAGMVVLAVPFLLCVVYTRNIKFRTTLTRATINLSALLNPPWAIGRRLRLVLGAYFFSIISHLGIVGAHWAAMQAVGLDVAGGAAVWLVLLGSAALLLPLAINGLGLQEGVYLVLLDHYGSTPAEALGVALLIRLLMLVFSLFGGLAALGSRHSRTVDQGEVRDPIAADAILQRQTSI